MIVSYEEFYELVRKTIKDQQGFYEELVENIVDNPSRFCGVFRLTTVRTKLIQNVSQSNEIKFGDILEELVTDYYLERLGYVNLNKELGVGRSGRKLRVDQIFCDKENDNVLYIVEMKVRDDHDSTKIYGQYSNFHDKIIKSHELYPNKHLIASMWFVDPSLTKNKKRYLEKIEEDRKEFPNTEINLFYGEEFFQILRNGQEAWKEFYSLFQTYHDKDLIDIDIPDDLSTDERILEALINLPVGKWNKLMSDDPEYITLRRELFSFETNPNNNLIKAKKARMTK